MESNRNKSSESNFCKNKVANLNRKMNCLNLNKIKNKEQKKGEIDIESPEEMHYFLVNLLINYKLLNGNF